MSDDLDQMQAAPHNIDAEMIVLGSMMMSGPAINEAETLLKPVHFYRPAHATIFKTIVELAAQKKPADPIAVAGELGGHLSSVGGANYLHACYAAVPLAVQVGHYAKLVKQKATERRLLELAATIKQGVFNPDTGGAVGADDLLDRIRETLTDIEDSRAASADGPVVWGELMEQVCDAVEQAEALPEDSVPGVPTGFADLDRLTGGFRPGQLVVVAARTSVGKSVAAAGFAQYAACAHKLPSLVFSLEMPAVEIGTRFMASGARVPLDSLSSGRMSEEQWLRVARYMGDTGDAPLYVDSTSNVTLADIRARSRRLHRQVGLKLIVVDYLQLVESARAESRQMAVAAVSRGLKLLAMELGVPVVAVAQLNRGPENRTDKRPTKGDLRESGAIENDADVIIFLHREDYYDKESPRAGEADFIVDKNRNGSTDTVTVAAQLHLSRFVDMAIV